MEEEKTTVFREINETILKNAIDLDKNSLQKSINDSLKYANENVEKNLDGKRNVNHMIFEMNEFYIEMAEKLRELRFEFTNDFNEFECESTYSEDLFKSLEKYGNPVEIRKQLEIMKKLDEDIENKYKDLKSEREERYDIEKQLCEILENDDEFDKDSQKFLSFCEQFNSPKPSPDTPTESNAEKKKSSDKAKAEPKFIKRNIDLANSKDMASFSLTDEEKMKLETMLSETGDNDFDQEKLALTEIQQKEQNEIDLINSQMAYDFEESDLLRLQELETQLQALSELKLTSEPSTVSLISTATNFEDIEKDEKEGKYWKTDQRLKKIEDELIIIGEEKETFDLNAVRVEVDIENLVENARRDLMKIIENEEIRSKNENMENEEQLDVQIKETEVESEGPVVVENTEEIKNTTA